MSSPGGLDMVNRLPQNALQHGDSCVVNFGSKLKIALTGVRSRIRESLAKTANLILLTLYFLVKLTYVHIESAY